MGFQMPEVQDKDPFCSSDSDVDSVSDSEELPDK